MGGCSWGCILASLRMCPGLTQDVSSQQAGSLAARDLSQGPGHCSDISF